MHLKHHTPGGTGLEAAMVKLDNVDRRLLAILQEDNRLTNLQLAAKAHLSPPTCLRRVRRLREEKVIVAEVAILDPHVLGQSFHVLVEVVLDRQSEQMQMAFERKMAGLNEVVQCYMVSGDTDFIAIVQVADMDAYHRFVRRHLTSDSNVRNFRSVFVMNRSKYRTQINLVEG